MSTEDAVYLLAHENGVKIDKFLKPAHLMRELEPSRNVVCHMNPLDSGNITDLKSWFRKWEKVVKQGLADGTIPSA